MTKQTLLSTGKSFKDYYKSLNKKYLQLFKKYYMLHYPFFQEHGESLEERQINLSNFCINEIQTNGSSTVLDVGCGNGVQSIYIAEKLKPSVMLGVDINDDNIKLARQLSENKVSFQVDDAQELSTIEDQSIDVLFCVESAFHYPDKSAFLAQVSRVLKPGGFFLIADITTKSYKKRRLIGKWKQKMYYYHWTLSEYASTFDKSGLVVKKQTDITPDVIKGYHGYADWIQRHQCSSYLKFVLMRAFISVQVVINVYLLKKRRNYIVFVGSKN